MSLSSAQYLQQLTLDSSLHEYEEAVSKQPFLLSNWLSYIDAVEERPEFRLWVGRRALQRLPRSYKLWKLQWEYILQRNRSEEALQCFQRALWYLHAYPRVWISYFQFLTSDIQQYSVTFVRRTINRALQAVPVTQHERLWPIITKLVETVDYWPLPTRIRILERYAEFEPHSAKDLAYFLMEHQQWGKAARVLLQVMNQKVTAQDDEDEDCMAFLTVCSQHSEEVEAAGIPWQAIVRSLLNKQESTIQGWLWTQLADAWIRRGQFDLARSIYEEGLERVTTVRDFSILYDAYLELEQGLLEAAVSRIEEEDEAPEGEAEQEPQDDWDILLHTGTQSQLAEMEWAVARAEHLTSRRPLLLNQVLIRQNPNNVGEWLQRAELYLRLEQSHQAAHSLEKALSTVEAKQAFNGLPNELVVKLADIYERNQEVHKARDLFDRMCQQHSYRFRKADDLAECWAAWIELELRHEQWDTALSLARQSISPGSGGALNLTKCLRLWDLLLDLEESLGTTQTTKDAYNRALDIKAATVQHVINFGSYLTEQKYFEESFTAYERGIELFAFPHPGAKVIWNAYLKAFLNRYNGSKVERCRDLFQRCLELCPAEESAEFFLMNGEFEEKHGLTKRALSVYRSMCDKVPNDEKLTAYKLFIAKTSKYLGVTATRDIYQHAIEILKDQDAAKLCLDFHRMETDLQQIDRARRILAYGAQMADPRRMPEYWKTWNEFEIAHGNEETFREMLRVKRSVEAAFSNVNYGATGISEKAKVLTEDETMRMIAESEGVELEVPQNTAVAGFVSSKRPAASVNLDVVEERVAKLRKVTGIVTTGNDDDRDDAEIDIDEIDAEIEEAVAEGSTTVALGTNAAHKTNAETIQVSEELVEGARGPPKGALERLQRAGK